MFIQANIDMSIFLASISTLGKAQFRRRTSHVPLSQRILSPRRFCPPGPNPLADIVPPDNIR